MIRAFRVVVTNWPEAVGIYAAESAKQAKYMSYAAAKEAGYDVPFALLLVRRAPEYDDVLADFSTGVTGVSEDHARHLLKISTPGLPTCTAFQRRTT